jgi:hypothetical protein
MQSALRDPGEGGSVQCLTKSWCVATALSLNMLHSSANNFVMLPCSRGAPSRAAPLRSCRSMRRTALAHPA